MNTRWHDEFLTLCALFPTGELTDEEWALLQVHLAYCDSCLAAFREYEQIAHEVLPALAATANSLYENEEDIASSSFSLAAGERKLMRQLDPPKTVAFPNRVKVASLGVGLIAAGIVLVTYINVPHVSHQKARSSAVAIINPAATTPTPPVTTVASRNLRTEERQDVALRHQLNKLQDAYEEATVERDSLDKALKAANDERLRFAGEQAATTQQLEAQLTENTSLRDKLSASSTTLEEQRSRTATLEAKLRDLNSTVADRDRLLTLDKELLTHDRDIRELIGARDLYITDIYDVAKNGKTAKPFGRVFYTKDRSLVFYGYDLDKQSGLSQSVAFQAWGSTDKAQSISLGMFYQDESHKRWVLRFDDTKTLAHLNTVFVTAEPQGGSQRPTGKPLLLAYLQIQPNHP